MAFTYNNTLMRFSKHGERGRRKDPAEMHNGERWTQIQLQVLDIPI